MVNGASFEVAIPPTMGRWGTIHYNGPHNHSVRRASRPNLRRTRVELRPWAYIHESTSSRSCGFLRPLGSIRAFSEAVFAAELANFFLWS